MEENVRSRVDPASVPGVRPTPDLRELPGAATASVEWGAAALALAGVLAVLAAIGFLLIATVVSSHFSGMSRSDQRLAGVVGCFVALLMCAMCGVAFTFALVSVVAARRRGRTIALGLAGLLLGGLAGLLWVAAGLVWLGNTLDMF